MLQAANTNPLLLPLALGLAVLLLALIPAASAAAATAAAAAAGGARGGGGGISRGRAAGGRGRPAAFTLSVFGFGVGLPDIKMPSSAIEVRLVTQRVIDPMYVRRVRVVG